MGFPRAAELTGSNAEFSDDLLNMPVGSQNQNVVVSGVGDSQSTVQGKMDTVRIAKLVERPLGQLFLLLEGFVEDHHPTVSVVGNKNLILRDAHPRKILELPVIPTGHVMHVPQSCFELLVGAENLKAVSLYP